MPYSVSLHFRCRIAGMSTSVPERPPTERVTVALIPKAAADLDRLQERTRLSKTDITNRAVSLYEFVDAEISAGRELIVRDPRTGEAQLVKLF